MTVDETRFMPQNAEPPDAETSRGPKLINCRDEAAENGKPSLEPFSAHLLGRSKRGVSMRADQLPEEIHEAIRRWSEDYTNVEPWRGKNYPGENLVQYLYWAGWRIEPTPKTRREIQDRARSLRQDKVAVARSYGGHTAEQWQAMLKWAGHMCVKCSVPFGEGEPATKDHVIPLVNGGDDSIHNIQPLCLSCNSTKRTATTDHRNPGWWEAVL